MSDPNVVLTLRRKRDDIQGAIASYEKALVDARRDLEHVNATLLLFEKGGAPNGVKVYHDINRLFRRGEIVTICKAAMAEHGPLSTRELSHHVMKAKGFNADDNELRKAIAFRIVQALRLQHRRGTMGDAGKRDGARVWNLKGSTKKEVWHESKNCMD
jgi:hypothetical protein